MLAAAWQSKVPHVAVVSVLAVVTQTFVACMLHIVVLSLEEHECQGLQAARWWQQQMVGAGGAEAVARCPALGYGN